MDCSKREEKHYVAEEHKTGLHIWSNFGRIDPSYNPINTVPFLCISAHIGET